MFSLTRTRTFDQIFLDILLLYNGIPYLSDHEHASDVNGLELESSSRICRLDVQIMVCSLLNEDSAGGQSAH